jgi:hypothetical protein
MDNSPEIRPHGNGFKVFKRIGGSNYMFGYYKTEDEAKKIAARVANCKTEEDALKLYAYIRDVQKNRIPAPGVFKATDETWYAKIKLNDDYFLLAHCPTEPEALAAYETGLTFETVAQVMDFRKANKVNKDGRFRNDKNFLNPDNRTQYFHWLSKEGLTADAPKEEPKKTNKGHNAYFGRPKQDINISSELANFSKNVTPETKALFELLQQQEQDCITALTKVREQEQDCINALKSVRERIANYKRAMALLSEVALLSKVATN